MNKMLFVGGSFSVSIYAGMHRVRNFTVLANADQLLGFHISIPVFVMDDAPEIYGSEYRRIINALEDKEYKVTFLQYTDSFPEQLAIDIPENTDESL
jgi:hypothetical protein